MDTESQFAARYREMNEDELVEIARDYDSLTDAAQSAIRAEFAERKMEPPIHRAAPEPIPPGYWVLQRVVRATDFVTVATFRELSDAVVAQSFLQSAGIESFLRDEFMVRNNWFLSDFIGNMRLQVLAENEEPAREVLENLETAPTGDAVATFEPLRCPHCKSTDVHRKSTKRGLALAAMYLAGVPLPMKDAAWFCSSCGKSWKPEEE